MTHSNNPNANHSIANDDYPLQSSIDRYLLEDPSFDRAAFEQQMLEDGDLCERVAMSVAELQLVATAVRACGPVHAAMAGSTEFAALPPSSPLTVGRTAWLGPPMLALVAVLLVSFLLWRSIDLSNTAVPDQQGESHWASIAENWSELASAGDEPHTEPLDEELVTTSAPASLQTNAPESSEQNDWILDAAHEYYLASTQGTAG